MNLSRRKLLGGLGLLFAAPAVVRASSLMPVKPLIDLGKMQDAIVMLRKSQQVGMSTLNPNFIYMSVQDYRYLVGDGDYLPS